MPVSLVHSPGRHPSISHTHTHTTPHHTAHPLLLKVEVDAAAHKATVTREVDGGLETASALAGSV